jgi:glutathione reductase (NADPH)
MPRYDFDLFTIGAGSGGVAGTRRAGAYGARTAICEELRIGGTCVLRGCVPKKLLVYGSQFAEAFADAPGFGWSVPPATHDWAALIEAKDKEIGRLSQIYVNMLNNAKVKIFEARGVVVDPHTVEVGGNRYTAENIMIAVGGWPETPNIPGIEHVISSNEALDLPERPRRIVIVGGGYIAVEFAGIFNGFGSEVIEIIRADRVLRGFDDDVRTHLGEEMRIRGVDIRGGTQIARIDKTGSGYTVTTMAGGKIETDCVMYATGRAPNTKGMGLAEVGVEMQKNGAVKVDEWQRSSVKNIYAVGDVTDRINLTPVAIAESRAIAETLYNNNPIRMDHADVPSAVFSQPPIGTVGLTEEQARRQYGDDVDVYCARFKPMKNTLSGRDERTFMKLVVDGKTDRVLGCHMLGADAPEIIQGLAIAVKCGASKKMFDQTVGIHPSAAEEFVTMREKFVRPQKLAAE